MEKMAANELVYFKKYLEGLENYNKAVSGQLSSELALVEDEQYDLSQNFVASSTIDLTTDLAPPKQLFIEVRVNKDYGTVVLPESGEVML